MGKIDIAKGQILHSKGEPVKDIAIILKGSFILQDGEDISLKAGNGAVLGAFHPHGGTYHYDYKAAEDSTLFVYDYGSEEDLAAAVRATPTIAPVMVSASIALLNGLLDTLASLQEKGVALCKGLQSDYADYRDVCATLMLAPRTFDAVNNLVPPKKPAILSGWQAALCRSYREKNDLLRKEYYPADINFCIGTILMASKLAQLLQPQIDSTAEFIRKTTSDMDPFIKEYHSQKAKLDDAKRQEAMEAGSGSLPKIQNALNTILAFADIDREIGDAFAADLRRFMQCPDKTEKSDEMRRLRINITKNFYAIYEAAFFKSLEEAHIPAEVKMFFFFGFVDEELAGEANTAALYKFALLWENDPNGRIIPAYHWLRKVYSGEVPPSKDEFDNYWPDYLREQVRQNALTQKEADNMLDDGKARVSFELNNMFTSANKMTYGSIFSFVPVFFAQPAARPLDACLASAERVTNAINRVRDIDFGCFYRPAFTSYTQWKINRFVYNREVLPYVILMPNFGSRGIMWQEIEDRKRTTPAHMMLSILHSETLEDTIVKMCAQFRWEMCKRIQGVHYSDIGEPSLTSEYCNYLQFYKKNASLSADVKEKVKASLKRNANSYSNVFAAEYDLYIKHESEGLPRLNKVARDILFRYCTFSRKYRDTLSINPQYRPLIERWSVLHDDQERTFNLFARRILTMTETLPEEVQIEAEYLKL